MNRSAAAWLAGALALAAAPGAARADDGPMSRLALVLGWGQSDGQMADRWFQSYLFGMEAGVQWRLGRSFDLGMAWSLQYSCWDDYSCIDKSLATYDMEAVARLRFRVPSSLEGAAYLMVEGGVDLGRSSLPLPPDEKRLYLGPVTGGALEYGAGNYLVSVGFRTGVGFIGDDPPGIRFLVRVATGLK